MLLDWNVIEMVIQRSFQPSHSTLVTLLSAQGSPSIRQAASHLREEAVQSKTQQEDNLCRHFRIKTDLLSLK